MARLPGQARSTVEDFPPAAVDALVRSESLRDFGSDRVVFHHDVLAEWAVSSLLSDLGAFDRLPLQRPAPAMLARGVELAARFAIERGSDSIAWQQLLERVSREGVHGSWRRAALLALVRSEAAADVLLRASELLLANHARLLRELIRTVQAVDVRPASQLFAALGLDPAAVPPHINAPHGPAWFRLIMWLLALEDRLLAAAIPDVVGLYFDWSLSMWGRDPLTPRLLHVAPSMAERDRGRARDRVDSRVPRALRRRPGWRQLERPRGQLAHRVRGFLRSNAGTGRELSRGGNGGGGAMSAP